MRGPTARVDADESLTAEVDDFQAFQTGIRQLASPASAA
jgi:hypothetical protein